MEGIPEVKILIYFSPRQTAQFEGHPAPGDWIVAQPRQALSLGQTVTWKAVGNCQQLELDLPDIFDGDRQIKTSNCSVAATVRANAPSGPYAYEAYVNGQLALGGSSPILIIDP